MSALIYGHCFVAVSDGPPPLVSAASYGRCRERAQREVMRTGGELLIGPALLLTFHEVSMLPHHLVFPMAHETAGVQ